MPAYQAPTAHLELWEYSPRSTSQRRVLLLAPLSDKTGSETASNQLRSQSLEQAAELDLNPGLLPFCLGLGKARRQVLVVTGANTEAGCWVGGFNTTEETAVKFTDPRANLPAPHCLVTVTSSVTSVGFSLCICKIKVPLAHFRECGED